MPWATTRVLSIVYCPSTVFTSCITNSVSLGTQPSLLPDFGPIRMKLWSSQMSRNVLAIVLAVLAALARRRGTRRSGRTTCSRRSCPGRTPSTRGRVPSLARFMQAGLDLRLVVLLRIVLLVLTAFIPRPRTLLPVAGTDPSDLSSASAALRVPCPRTTAAANFVRQARPARRRASPSPSRPCPPSFRFTSILTSVPGVELAAIAVR